MSASTSRTKMQRYLIETEGDLGFGFKLGIRWDPPDAGNWFVGEVLIGGPVSAAPDSVELWDVVTRIVSKWQQVVIVESVVGGGDGEDDGMLEPSTAEDILRPHEGGSGHRRRRWWFGFWEQHWYRLLADLKDAGYTLRSVKRFGRLMG